MGEIERPKGMSLEVLRQIANNAGLDLSDEEIEQMAPQLEALLQNIRRLDSLDLSQSEPATLLHLWWS